LVAYDLTIMSREKDPPSPQKPPATSPEREARLAKALRDNLRRRKAAAPAKPSGDGAD
jgi:hypothetical protein